MGPAALVQQVDKLRPPFNVSVLNCECALFALGHQDVFAAQATDIRAQRARLLATLGATPGLTVFESDANMILVRVERLSSGETSDRAQSVFEGMKARGVLVKNVSKMHPLLAHCLRLTVGTATENDHMITALHNSL
jgi:histidinol-phosphate aminotransferase